MNEPRTGDADSSPSDECPASWLASEDWWAILLGATILLGLLAATWLSLPADNSPLIAEHARLAGRLEDAPPEGVSRAEHREGIEKEMAGLLKQMAPNPVAAWFGKLGSWDNDPLKAFEDKEGKNILPRVAGIFIVALLLFGVAQAVMGGRMGSFPVAFALLFLLATLAFVLAGQKVIKHYNLEYALWALAVGLAISNTIGTPGWMRPALRTELYIKTGLVLLGAAILLNQLLALGKPGIFIAWVVTPIVLTTTYLFGQYVLKVPSKSLNMVISADMSVCGVSAAIATAAACKAKKEELSLAIGLSLGFTVLMMVVMPPIIVAMGLSEVVGGAWIGGTIDSTGAVAAAGSMLGETAEATAVTIKMIQNILIGVVAFAVAVYWVTCVERTENGPRPSVIEVWRRFPKFVLGFVGASILFTYVNTRGLEGEAVAAAVTGTSDTLRGWFFCLAFVSIGLESNFRELSKQMAGGKPLILYVSGQCLNLALTLLMAWLMFEKVFPDAARSLGN